MADSVLNVRIVTPRQVLFEGIALSVSSVNSTGRFDILPEHANFITIIENNPIIVRGVDKRSLKGNFQDELTRFPYKKITTYNFPLAIIYTAKNIVRIYTSF